MPTETKQTNVDRQVSEQNYLLLLREYLERDYNDVLAAITSKKANITKALGALKARKSAVEEDIEKKLVLEQQKKAEQEKRQQEIEGERKSLLEATKEPVEEIIDPKVEVKAEEVVETKAEEKAEEAQPTVVEQKPQVEKPKIKFYVPEENPKDRRYQRPQGQQGGYQKEGGFQRNGAVRPNQPSTDRPAQRPGMTPPPAQVQPQSQKKKTGPKDAPRSIFDDKHGMNKKAQVARGYMSGHSAFEYDEMGDIVKVRTKKFGDKSKKATVQQQIESAVITTPTLTVKQLSEKIGKTGAEIIKVLFQLDINKTINEYIDFDTASLIASEFGITLELKVEQTYEDKLNAIHEEEDTEENLKPRPPIVTIMGHVDHGKTSILDYIRKAHVASGEAGGITQHIGAYTITLPSAGTITFLDTPGHEAFTSMRMRGANVTDIAVIVVAADDGIMPQTIEAINHAKAANVEIIIAVNKMDKTGADPDRILQQLTQYDIIPEEWGGNVPVVKVSAKTGQNIDKLLDTILLVAEIMELKANPDKQAKGAIIEARLDKGKGPVATVLVQNGTLKVGDYIIAGTVTGKVRAMQADDGSLIKVAGPSIPVAVLGFESVPNAGDQVMSTTDISLVRKVSDLRERNKIVDNGPKIRTLEDMLASSAEEKLTELNVIIKADVQGSVEAVKQAVEKLSNEEVKVKIMHSGVGAINDSDIMLAKTDYTMIIGFNVVPDNSAKKEAERSKIDIRTYRIIYDVIDDITRAVQGLLSPKFAEKYMGRAEIRQVFRISGVGNVAGCMVRDGKIVRGAKVRLLREGVIVYEGEISSLKREKNDAKEVATNFECGIGILNFNDIAVGDVIESFIMEQVNA